MKSVVTKLLLIAFCSLLPAAGHAASGPGAITALNCTFQDGTALKLPVYAYTVDTTVGGSRFFTVYTDSTRFNELTYFEYFLTSGFSACSFTGNPTTYYLTSVIEDVTIADAGTSITVNSTNGSVTGTSKSYTGVTFSYQVIQIGTITSQVSKPMTPEEKAKALADFKARGLALPRN